MEIQKKEKEKKNGAMVLIAIQSMRYKKKEKLKKNKKGTYIISVPR